MGTTYQIAEVAQRSGFTPSTLRYYEDIGLVSPTRRTDAGYRLYDDTSLERLRFIARAKQLGCSLDEVAELASVRDGGRCAPVQERLRSTVEAKVAEARDQIAALTALATDLRAAAATLTGAPVDGPCDDTCACVSGTAPSSPTPRPAPVAAADDALAVAAASEHAGDAPVACTLGAGEMAARVDEWNAVLAATPDLRRGVIARRALDDGGLRLEFGADTDVADLARLAAAEQGCCRFFAFALVVDGRGIALEVHAPDDARPVLAALFGAPDRGPTRFRAP